MRKFPIVIGTCMVIALVLTVVGQESALDPVMKQVGPTFQSLQAGITAKDAAKVAADAAKLEGLFKEAEAFFVKEKLDDAISLAKQAGGAAGETAKAAKAGDMDAATTASAGIGKCKACHAVHREQLPDKSFKFKR